MLHPTFSGTKFLLLSDQKRASRIRLRVARLCLLMVQLPIICFHSCPHASAPVPEVAPPLLKELHINFFTAHIFGGMPGGFIYECAYGGVFCTKWVWRVHGMQVYHLHLAQCYGDGKYVMYVLFTWLMYGCVYITSICYIHVSQDIQGCLNLCADHSSFRGCKSGVHMTTPLVGHYRWPRKNSLFFGTLCVRKCFDIWISFCRK